MAVEIAHDTHRQVAIMYDNTTDTAFGPIFQGPGCAEDADDFIDWLQRNGPILDSQIVRVGLGDGTDPRDYSNGSLDRLYTRWLRADDNRRGV